MSTTTITPTSTGSRYASAILNVVGVFTTALIAVVAGPFTWTIGAQLALVLIGAVASFIVPLSASKWSGYLKTGAAILAALLTALLPFLTEGTPTLQNWLVVGLAGVTALGTELGVQIRTTPTDTAVVTVAPPLATSADYIGRHAEGDTVPPLADASVDNSGNQS